MNYNKPIKTWKWVKKGGEAAWGYFGNGIDCERMWVWRKNSNANCAD